jgi:hypothetical protein
MPLDAARARDGRLSKNSRRSLFCDYANKHLFVLSVVCTLSVSACLLVSASFQQGMIDQDRTG